MRSCMPREYRRAPGGEVVYFSSDKWWVENIPASCMFKLGLLFPGMILLPQRDVTSRAHED